MRVIKPFSASILTRSFEYKGKPYLGVSVLLFSPMGEEIQLLPEKDLWPFWASQPESQAPLEAGFPRRHAEYLVCGSAWTVAERRDAVAVRACVGHLRKDLVVWGARHWEGSRPSVAKPFESMRLRWEQTYGGPDHAANPVGQGRAEAEINGLRLLPLPRVEYPQRPLTSPRDEGLPAGFGPIDLMWAQRASLRGTYDERWLKEEFPGLASDMDWRFFNAAPLDQQQTGAFEGDETYEFQNLHPHKPMLKGRLNGLSTRVFVDRLADGVVKFEEVRTKLTGLWFFPGEERVIQVYQGALEVQEDDASDVHLLLAAIEHGKQALPAAHYRAVRDKRLDKQDGALETLRESDLVPKNIAAALHDFTPSRNRGLERALKRAEGDREKARAEVAAQGLDLDEHAPPVKGPPTPEIRSIDDLLEARKTMAQQGAELPGRMAAEKSKAMADARAAYAPSGRDFAMIEAEVAGKMTSGPPPALASRLEQDFLALIAGGKQSGGDIRELEEMLADPKVMAQWRQGDAAQLASYRMGAQHQAAAMRLAPEDSARLAKRLLAAHAKGESLAGWDLTGVQLSGLDLRAADLSGALMESAEIRNCNLQGAVMEGTCLVRTSFDSCLMDDANLSKANLSLAVLGNTSIQRADLSGALLAKTRLTRVDLSGSRLDEVQLREVLFEGVDLSAAQCDSMLLLNELSLTGTRLQNARLKRVAFTACDLSGVDMSGMHCEKAAFVGCKADRAKLNGVVIGAGCFVAGCSLQEADLSHATLEKICFRTTPMGGSNLTDARIRNSDFSECDLRSARFHGADARGALFVRSRLEYASLASCNLAGAVLQHAWLQDTDFRGANLHEGDMARVRLGQRVQFQGALTTRMRTLPRRPARSTAV
jgi:uncharacterized protein YjbI with pentapeptide repeats